MITHRNLLVLTSAVLATVQHVGAQILGCDELGCPVASGTESCTVADKTFRHVGAASVDIPDRNNVSIGLSWVKGVSSKAINGTDSVQYDQSFYLGTPPGFELHPSAGCALFFHDVSKNIKFNNSRDAPLPYAEGTCQETTMGPSCVSAVIELAQMAFEKVTPYDSCELLEETFASIITDACVGSLINGGNWSPYTIKNLHKASSKAPISGEQNATSDCWPVLPKNHDLRLIESIKRTGGSDQATEDDQFYGITPILTVLYPTAAGEINLVNYPRAQLTCLKTIKTHAIMSPEGDESRR